VPVRMSGSSIWGAHTVLFRSSSTWLLTGASSGKVFGYW
jgi:hypothetical protein